MCPRWEGIDHPCHVDDAAAVRQTTTATGVTFPHPTLSPVHGTPATAAILKLRKELHANACAIHTALGGGNNRHLGLAMNDITCIARAGVAPDAPVHPGPAPTIPAGATQHQIAEANRQHDRDIENHCVCHAAKEELKKQILAAVDNKCVTTPEGDEFGCADVTSCQLLNHLQNTCATMTPDDIETNQNSLTLPWNIDQPIENLWERITKAQSVAAQAQEPAMDATAIRLTATVLESTGVFQCTLDVWRNKPEANKTKPIFKTHFSTENKEQLHKLTAKTAGCHGAHEAKTKPSPVTPSQHPASCRKDATITDRKGGSTAVVAARQWRFPTP